MHNAQEAAWTVVAEDATRLGVHKLSALRPQEDGRNALTLELEIDGERARIRVVLPAAFPFGEIEMMLESPEWRRFPHQSAAGKICPDPNSISSHDASRLVEAIEAAREWLGAARSGELTPAGGRYELPDVPIRSREWLLLFDEEAAEYRRWTAHAGDVGRVSVVRHAKGWAAEEFRTLAGAVVARRSSIRQPAEPVRRDGIWVVVSAFASDGHRFARTWDELRDVHPDLDRTVKRAWRASSDARAFVIVGAPIPGVWGGSPTRMHWQPIVFPSYRVARAQEKAASRSARRRLRRKNATQAVLWKRRSPIALDKVIPWAAAENVSRSRLYVRSTVPRRNAFEAPLLIGCGALGSAIADLLVRGGLPRIGLIDREVLEYGNLCRHVLDGASIGAPKARALAIHLELVSPSVRAHALAAGLPPLTPADQKLFGEAMDRADLLIDASGDDEVLEWLSTLGHERRVASVWTNSDASVGVGVLSAVREGLTVAELRAHFRDAIRAGSVPGVSPSRYRGPEPIVPGTGCWHPTFRGSWSRLVALGAGLCEWLTGAARGRRDGHIVVFRFHDGTWRRVRSWSVAVPREVVTHP